MMRPDPSALACCPSPVRVSLHWRCGSPGASEHPADHDTDDLNIVRLTLDAHGLVPAARALGAQLERRLGDGTHASEHNFTFDPCGHECRRCRR